MYFGNAFTEIKLNVKAHKIILISKNHSFNKTEFLNI
jgi:hypothetical protein